MYARIELSKLPVFCGFTQEEPNGWTYHKAANGNGLILHQGKAAKLFQDICPHRGSAILNGQNSTAVELTCPYHHWRFDGDGKCVSGDKDESLKDAFLLDLGGFLVGAPEKFSLPEGFQKEFTDFLSSINISSLKRVHTTRYTVAAPWWLWCENFLECKHCFANHPELRQTEAHIPPAHRGDHAAIFDVHEQTLKALRKFSVQAPTQVFWEGEDGVPSFWDASLLAHSGHATENREPAGPSIFKSGAQTNVFFYGAIGPFVHFTFYSDYVFVHVVIPFGKTETRITCIWFANGDSNDKENLAWLWDNTIRQDIELVERLAIGRDSARNFRPKFDSEEYQAERFYNWYNQGR